MFKAKENRVEYLGTTILIVLCFLLFTAYHQNLTKPDNSLRVHYQLSFGDTPAVSSKNILQLSSLQHFVSLVNEMNHRLSNERLKIRTDNIFISQRIVFLRKIGQLIKPIALQGFYYYHFSLSTEDLPVLS